MRKQKSAAKSALIFMSIITKATPLTGNSWRLSNEMTSRALGAVARLGGPRCCKRDSFTAAKEAAGFVKEKLGVEIVETDAHDVGPGADQDGQQTAVCPLDLKGMLNGRRQIIDDLRQTAAQGLRDEQRRPNNGDVEEKIKGEAA